MSMSAFGKRFGSVVTPSVILTLNPPHLRALVDDSILRKSTRLPRLENLSNSELRALMVKISSLYDTTVRTKWIAREIDKITAMIYFVLIISIFIVAEFSLKDFLDKFLVNFQGSEQARVILIVFSFTVLVAVLIMVIMRLRELKETSLTTFKSLIIRNIGKIDEQRFDKDLKELDQYLDNGDWTLAKLSVDDVMREYQEYIEPRIERVLEPNTKEKKLKKGNE
jgi:hypothetical protein